MFKILEPGTEPVTYILSQNNKFKKLTSSSSSLSSMTANIDHSKLVTSAQQSISEHGKRLLKAASAGNVRDVNSLLNQGSAFTSDWIGTSPLHLAAQNNRAEVCELLLKGGISKDARNKVDKTSLHLSAYQGHYKSSEILIKHGADVNALDILNMTPLHWATQKVHLSVIELLLRNGARTDIKNNFDLTPHDIACQMNNWEIVEILQAYQNNQQTDESENLLMPLEETSGKDIVEVDEEDITDSRNKSNKEFNSPMVNLKTGLLEKFNNDENVKLDPVVIDLSDEENNTQIQANSSNKLNTNKNAVDDDGGFSAMQLLHDHGIAMIPNDNDDTNLLNTVMESGHSVVLTDVGKEVLNTVKQQEEKFENKLSNPKRIITVTADQFLSLTNSNLIRPTHLPKVFKVVPVKPKVRRTIMNNNHRPTPFGNSIKVQVPTHPKQERQIDDVIKELAEAKCTIEKYKLKLKEKDTELERCKEQLKLFINSTNS